MSRPGSAPALGSAKEKIRQARLALEDARMPLQSLKGASFDHKIGRKKRTVVVEEIDTLRLRVYVGGPVIRGWVEISSLEEETDKG